MQTAIQLAVIFFSGIGISILFNVQGPRLLLNAAGAALTWAFYCFISARIDSVFWVYLIVTTGIGCICEILARITHTPMTLMLVPMIVPPLMPGGDLYNTFYRLITGSLSEAYITGTKLILEIAAINFGMVLAGTLAKLWTYARTEGKAIDTLRSERLN